MGNNLTASRYSGIKTDSVILVVSALTGLMAGFTSLFLTSRMGSTRPNVAQGYELSVIAMVVLGGVSTSGGSGRIGGPDSRRLHHRLSSTTASASSTSRPTCYSIIVGSLLILSVLVLNRTLQAGIDARLPPRAKMIAAGKSSRTRKSIEEEESMRKFFEVA